VTAYDTLRGLIPPGAPGGLSARVAHAPSAGRPLVGKSPVPPKQFLPVHSSVSEHPPFRPRSRLPELPPPRGKACVFGPGSISRVGQLTRSIVDWSWRRRTRKWGSEAGAGTFMFRRLVERGRTCHRFTYTAPIAVILRSSPPWNCVRQEGAGNAPRPSSRGKERGSAVTDEAAPSQPLARGTRTLSEISVRAEPLCRRYPRN
jgi:hypothetical protein